MKTVAIIQARMGSTRLPGKVLMDLAGAPVLQHVLNRTQMIRGVDEVMVATTWLPEDDPIAKHLMLEDALVFRGHPTDVLTRYRDAARDVEADTILRITADCPLLDPEIATEMLCEYRTYRLSQPETHYGSNCLEGRRTYPDGLDVEVFSRDLLEAAYLRKGTEGREHVTAWMALSGRAVHLFQSPNRGHCRWTLDVQSDLDWLRQVVPHLAPGAYTQLDTLRAIRASKAGRRFSGDEAGPLVPPLPGPIA